MKNSEADCVQPFAGQFGATSPAGKHNVETQTPIHTSTQYFRHCKLHNTYPLGTDKSAMSRGKQMASTGLQSILSMSSRILQHVESLAAKQSDSNDQDFERGDLQAGTSDMKITQIINQASPSSMETLSISKLITPVQKQEACTCTDTQALYPEILRTATTICFIWTLVKLTNRLPSVVFKMKGKTTLKGSILFARQLSYSGLHPVTFESRYPFFIEVLAEQNNLRASLTYGLRSTCQVLSQSPAQWRVHFLKAGLNSFGAGNNLAECQNETCSEHQAVVIHMPAHRCTDQKGYVVMQMLSSARAEVNGKPMLNPKLLLTGDKIVLQNLNCQEPNCTMYFFDLQSPP